MRASRPADLLIHPLGQRSNERLQQTGDLLPLAPPRPMPQHGERPLQVEWECHNTIHLAGSFSASDFLCRFYRFPSPKFVMALVFTS